MTKLCLVDDEDNVIKESEITIGESDKLLMSYNPRMGVETIEQVFNFVKRGLENDSPMIAYPQGITFKVLKKR